MGNFTQMQIGNQQYALFFPVSATQRMQMKGLTIDLGCLQLHDVKIKNFGAKKKDEKGVWFSGEFLISENYWVCFYLRILFI
jgi:hypothetical protein